MPLTEKAYIQINQALFSLAHAYESRMKKEMRSDANFLSLYECALVMVLGQVAPVNSRALARLMDVTASMISIYVRKLSKKGLVKVAWDENDNRNGWLSLTDLGMYAYREIIEHTALYTQDFLSALSDEEQSTLHALLLKASHSLGFDWQ